MAEYISRDVAIIEFMDNDIDHIQASNGKEAVQILSDIPAADVVPVVHGHWEYKYDTYCGFKDTDVRCSVCKTTTNIKRFRKTKWCPDCGAKMDGMREQIIEHGG